MPDQKEDLTLRSTLRRRTSKLIWCFTFFLFFELTIVLFAKTSPSNPFVSAVNSLKFASAAEIFHTVSNTDQLVWIISSKSSHFCWFQTYTNSWKSTLLPLERSWICFWYIGRCSASETIRFFCTNADRNYCIWFRLHGDLWSFHNNLKQQLKDKKIA